MKLRLLLWLTLTAVAGLGFLRLAFGPAAPPGSASTEATFLHDTAGAHAAELAAVSDPGAPSFKVTQAEPVETSLNSLLDKLASETSFDDPEAMAEAAAHVRLEEIPDLLQRCQAMTNGVAAKFESQLVRRWAELNPEAAAAWLGKLPPGERSEQAARQVAVGWSEADLGGAIKWAASLASGSVNEQAVLAVAYEAARTEPAEAIELARKLEPGTGRDELLVHALSQWAGADLASAATWVEQVPDENLREALQSALLVAAAEQNPENSAALLATTLKSGPEQQRTAVAVVQRWAQLDPRQAAAWVQLFPSDATGEAAVGTLVELWAAQDSQAAAAWAQALPPGKLQETALRKLAQQGEFESR